MPIPHVARLALLAVASVQSACSSSTQTRTARTCTGQRVLVVSNQTSGPLDIYMFVPRQNAQVIGIADAGQSELVLPPTAPSPAAFMARRPDTRNPVGPPRFTYYEQCR